MKHNPFVRTSQNSVMVRVCDVPLSMHDSEIINLLRGLGAEVLGECTREKLCVKGQLVNCLTGNTLLK